MHTDSLNLMDELLSSFASQGKGRTVYDIGSQNFNGTYRELLEKRNWKYVGLDICEGPNVDAVILENGPWFHELISAPADLVVSGQCLEHTKRPWQWIINAKELLAENGTLIIIAPSMWPEHRYPVDCWRILPDGMRALADWANLDCLDAGLRWPKQFTSNHEDCWAVMKRKN